MMFNVHFYTRFSVQETTPSPNQPLLALASLRLEVLILVGSLSLLAKLISPNGTLPSLMTPNVRSSFFPLYHIHHSQSNLSIQLFGSTASSYYQVPIALTVIIFLFVLVVDYMRILLTKTQEWWVPSTLQPPETLSTLSKLMPRMLHHQEYVLP